MTPQGPHCMCKEGYATNKRDGDCQDVNECASTNTSVCDHFCSNTVGSFNCSCAENYALQEDGKSCRTTVPGKALLFMAQGNDIRMLDLDLTMYSQVYEGFKQSIAIAYDPIDDMVFWSTDEGVYRIPRRGGTIPSIVVNEGVGMVEGLAVDWLGRNLYMTDSEGEQVLVCSLDGTSCHVLVSNISYPRGIQLDLVNRFVYWTDVNRSLIERAGMDGSDRTVIISDGAKWPNGLWIDAPVQRIYIADAHTDEVFHVNYNGTDRKYLAEAAVDHPFAIAVWQERLYWSDWEHDHIRSCLKRSGKQTRQIVKGSHSDFFGLTIYHPAMMPQTINPCSSRLCSHLCLMSPGSDPGYTCACPAEMELADDHHSCVDHPERTYPFIADGSKIYQISPRLHGHSTFRSWTPRVELKRIGGFAYDPQQNNVIVSDIWGGTIYSINRDTGISVAIVENVSRAVGVAVDWQRRNVYWVDGVKKAVEVVRDNGAFRTEIVTSLQHPSSIAVAPLLGFLYVSDISAQAFIMRCGLDGSSCQKIVTSDLIQPMSLTFERNPNIKRLYWCDRVLGRIESVAEDGTDRRVFVENLKSPVSLLVTGLYIMWSEESTSLLYQASKLGTPSVRKRALQLGAPESDERSLKLLEVGWKLPEYLATAGHPCQQSNDTCSQLCLGNGFSEKVCACSFGFKLEADRRTCAAVQCRDDQFTCHRSHSCIPGTWRCDSTPDCQNGEDEDDCQLMKQCEDNEFQCPSGSCVNKLWTCDGVHDCEDGSDEKLDECKNVTCSNSAYWRCRSGMCIPRIWVCDREKECEDGSDEEDCPTTCPSHKITCRDGTCVPKRWVCDGDKDCQDGSDEEDCSECAASEFTCSNSNCIPQHATCDGEDDCGDGSDEALPRCQPTEPPAACPVGQVLCERPDAVSPPVCIHHDSVCNGVRDCPLGEDEDCDSCSRYEYSCKSRGCIPRSWVCDGEEDCTDGSDEGLAASCPNVKNDTVSPSVKMSGGVVTPRPGCARGLFECGLGECIAEFLVCDGQADCSDGSDEGSYCEKSCRNNGGCQHKCHQEPTGRHCSCWTGFQLAADKTSCIDVKECDNETTCSQLCEEMHGYYLCSCLPGYTLGLDKRSCKHQVGDEWMVVVHPKSILNMSHSLHLAEKMVMPSSVAISSLEFLTETQSFVYADKVNGIIGKMGKDGVSTTLFNHRRHPRGVALDPLTNSVYFSEQFRNDVAVDNGSNYSLILACRMDGDRECSTVYQIHGEEIPSIRVAPRARRLFFCTNNEGKDFAKIVTSDMDGKSARIINQKVVRCGDLAVDEAKERVYWTDLARDVVESVTWSGEGHRIVQENVHSPIGLALAGDSVVWLETPSHKVMKCNKYQMGICNNYSMATAGTALTIEHPMEISVFGGTEDCKAKKCTHQCMISKDNKASCMCKVGYATASNRPNECIKMKSCDHNPCHGGGLCESHSDTEFICRCPENREGTLCEVSKTPTTDDISDGGSSTATLGVCLFLIIFGALIFGLYWYRKRPFAFWKGKGGQLRKRCFKANQTLRFANPGFGIISHSTMPNGNPMPNTGAVPSTPPILQGSHNFENPFFKTEEHMPDTSVDSAIVSAADSTSINIAPHQVDLTTPQHVVKPPEKRVEWDLSPFQPLQPPV
ncbi:low-density lipoprotein receptor-related protein 2-like isoform X1 [Penaeus japonicus]|uniref:low-density lipoprotein receptor-related protein 2-like isoform X1 n=1 Tax=Penaeus japonicus TaxID=27405 RepID=UPI001C70FFAB|nr:low-density lipoprotein receptor-related protein 2-like isoform X1 [Penaeus japonicus]